MGGFLLHAATALAIAKAMLAFLALLVVLALWVDFLRDFVVDVVVALRRWAVVVLVVAVVFQWALW